MHLAECGVRRPTRISATSSGRRRGDRVKLRNLVALITGAAIAWPFGVCAQQPIPMIGYLSGGSPESDNIPARLTAFREGLNETGYAEGQNVVIEYRWAEGHYDRLPALAADLLGSALIRGIFTWATRYFSKDRHED